MSMARAERLAYQGFAPKKHRRSASDCWLQTKTELKYIEIKIR
jgi:hypothetical protein